MKAPLFAKVKEVVAQWIKDKEDILKNVMIEIIKNNDECLYVILDFGECMAAIVVAEPDFAPYRFVSFEAGALVNGVHKTVYSWYDKDGTTIEEIINNLNNAIDVVIEYNKMKS